MSVLGRPRRAARRRPPWTPGGLGRPLATALALLLAGCGGSSSPTTASVDDPATVVSIQNETLLPVSSRSCHVRGTVENITPDRTVDLTMHWQALDSSGNVIGRTALTVSGLLPGEVRTFEASGFFKNGLIPCSSISTFERSATTARVRT